MRRVHGDLALGRRADATLRAFAHQEPLIAHALETPQSPTHHAEGPDVGVHLRLMLMSLYAVLDGRLHLIDIEELRRLKGYEGELEELEEHLKEYAALYEAFVLCHDAAKWACISFTSAPGSRGEALGFTTEPFVHWDDIGVSERVKMRSRYLSLMHRFRELHPEERPEDVQRAFYLTYGIDVHYPGHDRAVRTPVYSALVRRVARAHRLSDRDTELLIDLIEHHLEPVTDFPQPHPGRLSRYHALAQSRGWDADDFVDLLQGCIFLDAVCGSMRASAHGRFHEADILVHFLRAEHDWAPWRRAEKETYREEARKRERQRVFHEVGLDGVALMELLRMEPGPAFGALLRDIQEGIVHGRALPRIGAKADEELARRAAQFYEKTFQPEAF